MWIAILLIIYCFLAWFKPKYALCLILVLLPTYQIRFQVLNIPLTFLEAMVLILFIIYVAKNIKDIKEIKQNIRNWQWPVLIWLIIATLAMFMAPDLRAAAGVWKAYFIEPILLLIVFLGLIKNKKDTKLVFSIFIFSALTVSIYAFCQKFIGEGVWSTEIWGQPKVLRITSFFPHPNFLGLYLGPLIILGLGQIFFYFKNKKLLIIYSIVFFIITFLSLIFARSEAAILAVLAGLFFLGLIIKSTQRYVLGLLIIILLLIFIFPVSRNYFIQKIGLQDLSGQLRLNIWQGAVELIKEKPILGVGLDGYEMLAPDYQKRFYHPETDELISVETHPYPHDLFLALWIELGLLGLIVFFWILIKFFIQGFRDIKKDPILHGSTMGAMVVILIHGLVDTPYFKNDLSILFWLIIGLMIILRRGGRVDESTVLEKP